MLVVDDIDVNRIILTKILSALGAVCDTAEDGREAGMDAHVDKPIVIDQLERTIQEVLNRKAQ